MKYLLCLIMLLSAGIMRGQLPTDTLAVDERNVHFDPLFNITNTSVKGLKGSLVSNFANDKMQGLQLSGISNVAGELRGAQFSVFSNVSMSPLRGIQFAIVNNISMGVKLGIQASLLSNMSSGKMRGLQTSLYNYADTIHGLQLGGINVTTSNPKGYQVGILNISQDSVNKHSYGLINIKPYSKIRLMSFGGNGTAMNFGMQVLNGSTYTILGIGAFYTGMNEFSGSVFYRLGKRFAINENMGIGGDIGVFHIETFEDDSDDKNHPDRLYSVQPRITFDYALPFKLKKRHDRPFGIYASAGYEVTNHYKRNGTFRHGLIAETGITYRLKPFDQIRLNTIQPYNISSIAKDSIRKRPWLAAAEVFAVNAFVHCFDRWVLEEDFSMTTMHTIRNNFKTGFVWDNDNFSTNQFMHPYHGGLYFSAARSNGMNFWQSYPYALGGSLMWEFFGENTPPSINDVFSTSIGGTALGEATYRLSSLVLDDSSRGGERFFRELLGLVVNPMRGLNRLLHGDAWRVRPYAARHHDFKKIPVSLQISGGLRYITDNGAFARGDYTPYMNLNFIYGNSMSSLNRPFDFFHVDLTFNMSDTQPLISDAHVLGMIYGHKLESKKGMEVKSGIYQHFNFYNSEAVRNGSTIVPYRISETAALGPGLIMRFPQIGNLKFLEQRIFVDGILMGGSQSDYYNILYRDYNLGSGYSAKVHTIAQFGNISLMILKSEFYHLFTWKGYSVERKEQLENLEYINAQGDPGNTMLFVFDPHLQLNVNRHLFIDVNATFYYRRTHYRQMDDCTRRTSVLRLGMVYSL